MKNNNYFVYEHITPDGMYYIGVTTDVKKRWIRNGALYKNTSLQPYIEKYGWENIQHQVLFSNQTKENALWIEDFLIMTATEDGVCINKNRSGLVSKEDDYHQQYYQQHREEWNTYQREYYQQHREEWNTYQREYYQQHREELITKQNEYRKQHREEWNTYQREYMKKYREEHRDELNSYQREYRKQHRDEYNAQQREYMKKYLQRKKQNSQLKELGYIPLF